MWCRNAAILPGQPSDHLSCFRQDNSDGTFDNIAFTCCVRFTLFATCTPSSLNVVTRSTGVPLKMTDSDEFSRIELGYGVRSLLMTFCDAKNRVCCLECALWTIQNKTGSFFGVKTSPLTTPGECQSQCLAMPSCVAADISESTELCVLQNTTAADEPSEFFTRFIRNPPCMTTTSGKWCTY